MGKTNYEQAMYKPFLDLNKYRPVLEFVEKEFTDEKEKVKTNISMYITNLLIHNHRLAVIKKKEPYFTRNTFSKWHTYTHAMNALKILEEKILIKTVLLGSKGDTSTVIESTKLLKDIFKKEEIDKKPHLDISQIPDIIEKDNHYVSILRKMLKLLKNEDIKIPNSFQKDRVKYNTIKIIKLSNNTFHAIYNFSIRTSKLSQPVFSWSLSPPSFSSSLPNIPPPLGSSFVRKFMELYLLNNDYFDKVKLSYSKETIKKFNPFESVYLTRIYKKNGTGRLFQKYGNSYQNIPSKDRKCMLINGEECSEIDFVSSHVNLLYSIEKLESPKYDIYMEAVKELFGSENKELRKVIKIIFQILINSTNFVNLVKAIEKEDEERKIWNLRDFKKKKKIILIETMDKSGISINALIKVLKKQNSLIAKHFFSGIGPILMFIESNILVSVLMKLREENIIGLPLHDSIICSKKDTKRVSQVMKEEYKKIMGFDIRVEVK